jgi:hypothetical protein
MWVRILDFNPSLQIASQSRRDCSEAAGEVSSIYSTPKASRAFAMAILVLVSKKAFANCSPSARPIRYTRVMKFSECTPECAFYDLEIGDIAQKVLGSCSVRVPSRLLATSIENGIAAILLSSKSVRAPIHVYELVWRCRRPRLVCSIVVWAHPFGFCRGVGWMSELNRFLFQAMTRVGTSGSALFGCSQQTFAAKYAVCPDPKGAPSKGVCD